MSGRRVPARPSSSGAPAGSAADVAGLRQELDSEGLSADERSQIAARLRLTPSERLRYLEDMIAFEELSRRARRVT
jgi:hypothetical protein